jgi:hypothetical protein
MLLELILIIIFIVILGLLLIFLKQRLYKEAIIASLMSLVWVIFYSYDYKGDDCILFGFLNLFAFVAWTTGLIIFAQIYEALKDRLKLWKAIILSGIIFLPSLFIIEWVGYNILKIQLATSYHGLFGLDLMHGTWYLKAYYLFSWLIFIGIYELASVKK